MSLVDKERILNGNPKKKLIIAFRNLKENYTKENALAYMDTYKDQPLSFILENARMIYSEPYYGYDFYKNIVAGPVDYPIFHEYETQLESVNSFIKENASKMKEKQAEMFTDLKHILQDKKDGHKNTLCVCKYISKDDPEARGKAVKICDDIYNFNHSDGAEKDDAEDELRDDIETMDKTAYALYAPYISKATKDPALMVRMPELEVGSISDIMTDTTKFESYIESVFIISKLNDDAVYSEAVSEIPFRTRNLFTGYLSESARTQIDSIAVEKVKSIDTYYASPKSAVNALFESSFEDALFMKDHLRTKTNILTMQKVAYEKLSDILLYEYWDANNLSDNVSSYNFFTEGTTIEEAYDEVITKLSKINYELGLIEESQEDDELDKAIGEVDTGDEEDTDSSDDKGKSSKKDEAPKPKNLSNKVQFAAMDAEAKQMKKKGEKALKGQERKNALKAVTQLPKNVIKSITDFKKKLEEKDIEKRKKFMIEPGYRKHAFRNFKLALLYGGAYYTDKALLPITAIFRHFSKQKDRRVRNELISEIETDIKICEEKISDANGNGDNKEKYKLMRIKNKLERELLRVKTNSKYV
jgi:hypothetical protein